MGVIEEARALVLKADFSDDFKAYAEQAYFWDGQFSNSSDSFDPNQLASALSYQIKLDGKRIEDENAVPIGASKYRGLPHLPPDMAWPEGLYFAAQLNLDDLAAVDRSGRLPSSGMLYFFFDSGANESVFHWDGDKSTLAIRAYPDPATLHHAKYYLDDFLKGETIEFKPYWLFYYNQGDAFDYRELRGLLPPDLINSVTKTLGASFETWDSGCRLYGRPHYWQGEDEDMGAPTDFDENGMPIWEPREPELLLFQDEFGEGNIHFWCDPAGAATGDFSDVWLGYSGT
jgi:hypothetical protein